MINEIKKVKIDENWYYIIVQNPELETEQFIGFNDEKTNEKFIPAFKTKDHAKACFAKMPKDLFNQTYDIQAVIEEDLFAVATEHGHKVYLLDSEGTILKELN